ncbi:MAG: SF1B family DNA helicase RecD2 [Chloroflexota bacterium]
MASLSGSVDRIVFRNSDSGFCVARFSAADPALGNGPLTVVGTLPDIRSGEMLHLTGSWETHPVHGRNFRVERFEEELPSSCEGIERYLSSGVIRGIGRVTAGRIVSEFGEETIRILDDDPERLRTVAGISEKRLEEIKASWMEQTRIRDLSMFLQDHGMSVALARRIHERFGEAAKTVIAEDPYRLAHEVHGIGFRTADSLARTLGVPRDSPSRYVAGLRYTLSEATERGHVFLPRAELLRQASKTLAAGREALEPALLELLRRGDAVLDGDSAYLTAFYRAEVGTVKLIEQLRRAPSVLEMDPRFNAKDVVQRAADAQGLELAPKQLEAVEQALQHKVSVLTGGPGTGKTSTLRTVITALEEQDVSFCLCAPTGRAAKRVAETTGRAASTIHRLLEYQPGLNLFNLDQTNPLPFEFVIVDEVSMLDLLLFYHLLKAVPPEAHLLLVGDADQLPAIGPGNVLRDLVASRLVATTTLTDLFRQARGSRIVLAAHAINHGELPLAHTSPQEDYYFIPAEQDDDVVKVIRRLLTERIPRRFGLDPVDDVQVVAPMHGGPAGVTALNTELQLLLNPPRPGGIDLERGDRRFRLGDKVMQIRNNYDKDVFNGDVGRITDIDRAEQLMTVEFPAVTGPIEVMYAGNELDDLTLAYAVSVHKAQGSEFPCIIMPVVRRHSILLQRHLLYTAVTRARLLCVLVGSPRAFAAGIERDTREQRNTRLAERLSVPESALQLDLV